MIQKISLLSMFFFISIRIQAQVTLFGTHSERIISIDSNGDNYTVIKYFTDGGPRHLLSASDGWIYGINSAGGDFDEGYFFRISSQGTDFSILHHFEAYGAFQLISFIEGEDENLYAYGNDKIFRLSDHGQTLNEIYDFEFYEGESAGATLQFAKDGFLYGAYYNMGNDDQGYLFKIREDGSDFLVIHNFDVGIPSAWNSVNNISFVSSPYDKLIGFYNYSLWGGGSTTFDYSNFFNVNEDGSGFTESMISGSDINNPLILSSNGFLYATTTGGGDFNRGTLFRMSHTGLGYTILKHFNTPGGERPTIKLYEASDGFIYGATRAGGDIGQGTIFKFTTLDLNEIDFEIIYHIDADQGPFFFDPFFELNSSPTSTNQVTNDEIIFYPNPVSNVLNFSFSKEVKINSIRLYNNQGQIIDIILKPQDQQINVKQLPTGVYYLALSGNEKTYVQKFVKAN